MKSISLIIVLVVAALALGFVSGQWWPKQTEQGGTTNASNDDARKVLYYKAPMDPNYRSDQPGKSPMGMDLVPVYADGVGSNDPGVVSIDPKIINNLGVRSAAVEYGALPREINTVGYVGYDEDSYHQINTRVEGWIEHLAIKAGGDPVRKGQVLFELYSPTLVNAQQEYLAVLNSRDKAMLAASRERLAALGVTTGEIDRLDRERVVKQRTQIFAQADGVVVHLNVREGVFVTPAMAVMSIANLDQVWMSVEIFERQSAWVEAGQRAVAMLDALPGETLHGSVDYVYPELDKKTRTLTVRIRLDNTTGQLRPNMFARVSIFPEATSAVTHVPREALVRGGRVNRLVVELGDGQYRAQAVEVGIESGDRVEIRSGVAQGDRVVTSGQFLIDSESNIESALSRLEPTAEKTAMQVQVAGVVLGYRVAGRRIKLKHEPVSEWSWPAMSMSFEVSSSALLEGLQLDDTVLVTIDQTGDSSYLITDIQPSTPVQEGDAHSGHRMESPK